MEDGHRSLVGAVDQGTSGTRFLIFDSRTSELVTYHRVPIKQYFPKEGWVEQDPLEILNSVNECIEKAVANLSDLAINPSCIKAVGITNQRETTIVWDKETGLPLFNAIVWLDARTASTVEKLIAKAPNGKNQLRSTCGLPFSTYFSAVKLRWLLDNKPEVQQAVADGRCLFGTVDSWLVWNLTGGKNSGCHVTDVTNASRTMLMNLHTLQWDKHLCKFFEIPIDILPPIKSSSEIYGYIKDGVLRNVAISGILGDQQAALVGQTCFKLGQAKNTYGTGCFFLSNTGNTVVQSEHGLLTTVAYKFGPDQPAFYALEGSVAIAGAAVQWLRDNLNFISDAAEIETLAESVADTYGCYFVPAFSGLFCPYWQSDARGVIVGLSQFTTKAHIARACLEAICFQTRELLEAFRKDSGSAVTRVQVDGGMTANHLLMQLQADLTGLPVVCPSMPETTALGAAMAAGAAAKIAVWSLDPDDLTSTTSETYLPAITPAESNRKYGWWKEAVQRTMKWGNAEKGSVPASAGPNMRLRSLPAAFYVISSLALFILAEVR